MKKVIIIGLVIVVTTICIFLVFSRWIKNLEEDRALTLQLSPVLLNQLGGKQIYDFPYNPTPIQWDGKYLQVDHGAIFEEINPPLNFVYNKKRNEKLDTDRFFPGNDIKGIVWLAVNHNDVGTYDNGGMATQVYYVLYYLDLTQETILAQDTIWGGMPPKTIGGGAMGAVGKSPEEEEVIRAIQLRIQN
ncbi:MAG: hypothetical protein LBE91_12390 [Tannerella sp.]|jgi:hypothetical protein|nr:hypothetical protein [Tannerella sp.]